LIHLIYAAETLGFISYQPAYLSLYIKGKYLLNGVNFASSGSGYLDSTARIWVRLIKISYKLSDS